MMPTARTLPPAAADGVTRESGDGGPGATRPAGGRGRLLYGLDDLARSADLVGQGLAPDRGDGDPRPGPAAVGLLLDGYMPGVLEHREVALQVAVGEAEGVAQKGEIDLFRSCQDGQDAQADPLVHGVVKPLDGVGHAASDPNRSAAPPASMTTPTPQLYDPQLYVPRRRVQPGQCHARGEDHSGDRRRRDAAGQAAPGQVPDCDVQRPGQAVLEVGCRC